MKIRPKLTGAPMAYAMYLVDGTADPYREFGQSLWADDRAIAPRMKELVFVRSSIVNQCPT